MSWSKTRWTIWIFSARSRLLIRTGTVIRKLAAVSIELHLYSAAESLLRTHGKIMDRANARSERLSEFATELEKLIAEKERVRSADV